MSFEHKSDNENFLPSMQYREDLLSTLHQTKASQQKEVFKLPNSVQSVQEISFFAK